MEPSQKTIEMVFGFPKAGEVYGSFDVVSSNFDPNAGTWSVLFADKVNKKYALQALKPFLGKVAVFEVDGEEHSVEFPTKKVHVEYVRTNPPTGVQTLVQGRFTTNTALQNPTTVEDFEEELGKMTVKKPTKWFRVHPFKEVHSPAFRDKLWSFVTRRGESYGWVVGNEIYHRKGSLIMPYVKINKHVENAKVMYHTHPSKDEPSFSSADDIQWYLDAAYKWNIRHYYTIMANRLDHFEITTKGDKGRNSYLRMDEGKFISDLDTMLTKLEEQYKGEALTDEKFCQKVTRKWVEEINKRFGHILDIKYHSHIKKETPLKNPGSGIPLGVSKRIALDDKHISTALGELKGLDYDWIHYGGDEFAHTMYVYWWTKYHFLPKADGTDRLYMWEGLSKESRVKLRKYLAAEVEAGWTRADVLLMLGLYHDIAKRREKQDERHHSIIGAEMFRQEIGPEIGASQNITDIVSAMLDSDVGRRNITDEEFKVISSDMYILTRLFHMADRTAHHPYMFTNAAAKAREEGTLQVGDYGKAFIAMRNKEDITEVESLLRDQVISNPAPKIPYSVMYTASYEIAIDPDTSEMLFEEYDPRKVEGNDGKFGKSFRMSYGQGLYIRMPLRDGYVASASVTFAYPGKLNLLGIPARDDFGLGAANEVYQRVGQILSQVYNPNVERLPIENMEDGLSDVGNSDDDKVDVLPAANVSFPIQPIVNPKHQTSSVRGVVQQPSIVLAGPMGSGRREVAKKLAKQGYQICPMHTTQPSPPNRTPMRDSVDHTKESFMQLVKDDQMPYWMMDEKGNCYGYTKEQLNAPKTVMYTSPTMALRMKDTMPHIHIIYLDNNQSLQQHEMKLSSRTGITPRQAKAASKYNMHQKRKSNQFDMVVPVNEDDFDSAAEILNNPMSFWDETKKYHCPVCGISGMETMDWHCKDQTPVINNPQYNIEGVQFFSTVPPVKYTNLGAVSAEIEVDRNIPEEIVGNVKDIFFGLIEDYEKKTDKRVALSMAFAIDEITQEVKKRGGNGIAGFTIETGGSLGLPIIEFNKTIPSVIIATGDAIKLKKPIKKNPPQTFEEIIPVIFEISEDRQYTLFNRLIKLMEESGEIAEEVLIKEGFKPYKEPGKDGVEGEITDAIVVLLMAFERNGGTVEELKDLLNKSISKSGLKLKRNPHHCPIEAEARRAASDPSFIHHEWYVEHHLEYVMAIAKAIVNSDEPEDQQLIHDMVWMHDYPKMLGDKDNFELVRDFVYKHRSERYTDRLMNQLRWMEEIKSPDWSGRTTTIAAVMSTADALAHYYGPFFQIYIDEKPDTPMEEIKQSNAAKLKKDKLKLRAGPRQNGLDSVKFQYKGRNVRVVGNEHIAEMITKKNPMAPGYRSYSWTTEDWRSIKVNNKGDIDYKKKCGAEDTQVADGTPRLCLPVKVIRTLLRTESGKEILRKQARKKARAKKGQRVPWHPRIKKIWKNVDEKSPKDKPKSNPTKGITSIRIEESPNKEKKMVAYFFDKEGKKVKTTHFGARGMSDYTQHKDPERMKRYLARHSKMGEDWKDPTTAGALSRWILWGKPSLRESFNDYKKRFNLEGVMAVTNTRMNPMSGPEYRKNVKKALGKGMLTKNVMYHGSSVANIKKLNTNFNYLVGREVVFATPKYEYALAMAVESSNDDLDIGYINDEFTIAEMYEGAFDLLKEPSYIYQVPSTGFHQHPRLPPMEYIIEASMPVVRAKRVPNTYKELKRLGTTFVPYR